MAHPLVPLAAVTWLVMFFGVPAMGQATGRHGVHAPLRQAGPAAGRSTLPRPVRSADHVEPVPMDEPVPMETSRAMETAVPMNRSLPVDPSRRIYPSAPVHQSLSGHSLSMGVPGPPLHPHQILQPPRTPSSSAPHAHHGQPKSQRHPPHLAIKRKLQSPPAALPQANRRQTWKNPYSYGYFGASGKRHWSLHHGYRDRYTQWHLH